ncbi:MAG: transglutaminase domain-containing protein, partial [Mariprofundaceae bacterium]|nr:transglutaminase domain-containing protein [Mariprofundaceae bacterium]
MKSFPLLLIATLLAWGWFVDVLLLSALFVVLIGVAHWRAGQWQSSMQDFNPIGDLCGVGLIAFFIYFFLTGEATKVLYSTAQMLPVVCFPLLLAQGFSQQQKTPFTALLYRLRRSKEKIDWIDIRFSYVCLCLLSVGTAIPSHPWYYPVVVLLLAWMLLLSFPPRKKRVFFLWLLMFGSAVGVGYGGQVALYQAHAHLGKQVGQWMAQWFHGDDEASQGSTAMGQVGQLKLSDRILFRVEAKQTVRRPLLLRTASFDGYQKTIWFATKAQSHVLKEASGIWLLSQNIQSQKVLEIFQPFKMKEVLIPIPLGTEKITAFYVDEVQSNRFKSLGVRQEEGLINYKVHYNPKQQDLSLPQANDFKVSEAEKAAVAKVAAQLHLDALPPQQVVNAVSSFFQNKFEYSTWVQGPAEGRTALADFLLETRKGHCEYFASATVMLLRQAGIAARYATGFSLQEQSGDMLLVRGRDAHAWVLAYVDGQWINVDTTPPNWFELENDDQAMWQWWRDLLQDIKFSYDRWQLEDDDEDSRWWLWILLAVLAFPAWKIVRNIQFKRVQEAKEAEKAQGAESPFQAIEASLQATHPRQQGETLQHWIVRIEKTDVQAMLAWHYQHRFCATGLSVEDQHRFQKEVDIWLDEHE